MQEPVIYVASAGTGKTYTLMNELQEALKQTTPRTVIYTTFTNAGASEAIKRALEKFPQFTELDFKFFRTMHSIANRAIASRNMMGVADFIELGKELGVYINGQKALNSQESSPLNDSSIGDKLLQLDAIKRLRMCSYEDVMMQQDTSSFSVNEIKEFSENYRHFRNKNRLYDFTDQLEQLLLLLQNNEWCQPLTHLFIDEAQDLSNLQWAIVDEFSKLVSNVIIAGDDKQAIYGFSGGDPDSLINRKGTRRILETSYRLPNNILNFSEQIAGRIQNKQEYVCLSKKEGGNVYDILSLDDVDLSKGTWMLLVRNRKFLEYFEYILDQKNIIYSSSSGRCSVDPETIDCVTQWTNLMLGYAIEGRCIKTIYKRFLRGSGTVARGFKGTIKFVEDDEAKTLAELQSDHGLVANGTWDQVFSLPEKTIETIKKLEELGELNKKPRITVSTIHGVKGGEADNVIILPDMANLSYKGFLDQPDNEHRVFYVAATRAKTNLYLHQPITDMFYPIK